MMRVLSIIDESPINVVVGGGNPTTSISPSNTKKPTAHEGINRSSSSKRSRWKNWGWKQSPSKSASIEEEESSGQIESPKKSISLYSPTSMNQSPKHRMKVMSDEAVNSKGNSSRHQRIDKNNNEKSNAFFRASADARLIQMSEDYEDEKIEIFLDNLKDFDLLENRPASIHVSQNL